MRVQLLQGQAHQRPFVAHRQERCRRQPRARFENLALGEFEQARLHRIRVVIGDQLEAAGPITETGQRRLGVAQLRLQAASSSRRFGGTRTMSRVLP